MKLSAVFLLSVNVAVLSQVPATASDTASFLQESLSDVKPVAKQARRQSTAKPASKRAAGKISHSNQKYVALQPIADTTISLRPFMPGRYLPSATDLEPKYVSMAPRYDLGGPISGQVSATQYQPPTAVPQYKAAYQDYRADSGVKRMAEAAIKKVCQATGKSNRAIPGLSQVLPSQFQAPANAGPSSDFSQPAAGVVMQSSPQAPASPHGDSLRSFAAPAQLGPPMLSPNEDAQLTNLMEMSMPSRLYPQGVNGEMRGSVQGNPGFAGAGPPPFPLSFMQGQAPPTRGARPGMAMTAQQAKFGSWHDRNNLPQSGFQSYLAARMAGPIKPTAVLAGGGGQPSRKTGRQAISVRTQQRAAQQKMCPEKSPVCHKEPYVASYSPYRRYPG